MVPRECQFTEICLDLMSIYRDFMVPRVCQLTEILRCLEYLNLQRSYGARVCQFTEILWCLEYLNLQRSYGARVCQFTEILQRFHGAPEYVNVQRFCLDFMVPEYVNLRRFCRDLHDQAKHVKSL